MTSQPPCAARENATDIWANFLPMPGAAAHKHQRGHVVVVAGGLFGIGAPRLAARTALRIGAGLVTIAAPGQAAAAHAARGPDALMLRLVETAEDLAALLARLSRPCIVIGPALGLDARAHALVDTVLASDIPAVLDADALTLIAADDSLRAALVARHTATVLTPHAAEFARLAPDLPLGSRGSEGDDVGRLAAARALSASLGTVLVLKGQGTVIAAPDGRVLVNNTGSPALATAGTGDVLAGAVAGLMAQGMPAFEAAAAGVFWHGEAGQRLGMGLIADDLPEEIARLRWAQAGSA